MFDSRRLTLRHFDVQIFYDAAFLYFNTKGLLAERWAHGPVFAGFNDRGETVLLRPGIEDVMDIAGIYGLKTSAFMWERIDGTAGQAKDLMRRWFADCSKVLQPRRIARTYAKVMFSYPLNEGEVEAVAAVLRGRHPFAHQMAPDTDFTVSAGGNFAAWKYGQTTTEIRTMMYGIYVKEQAPGLVDVVQDFDDRPTLGMVYEVDQRDTADLDYGPKTIPAFIDRAYAAAKDIVSGTIVGVMNSA
jgi:hypothetical protein